MIFGFIHCDDKVFSGDQLRIDATKSFLAPGILFHPTLSHEISVDSGLTWYNISARKSVDWIFATSGIKTISLRLTTSLSLSEVFTKEITVLSQATQNLFSMDSDLYQFEPEIDSMLPKKWTSFNMVHLAAQEWIMDWLDEKRIFAENGTKYVVADLLDKQQVKQLSCYKVLEMIYEGTSNQVGDIFAAKKDKYRILVSDKASRSQLKLDYNKDGIAQPTERTDLMSVVIRRA